MLRAYTHDFWLLTSKMTIGKCCLSGCLWCFKLAHVEKSCSLLKMKWNEKDSVTNFKSVQSNLNEHSKICEKV